LIAAGIIIIPSEKVEANNILVIGLIANFFLLRESLPFGPIDLNHATVVDNGRYLTEAHAAQSLQNRLQDVRWNALCAKGLLGIVHLAIPKSRNPDPA
jgi:hypothetical protein